MRIFNLLFVAVFTVAGISCSQSIDKEGLANQYIDFQETTLQGINGPVDVQLRVTEIGDFSQSDFNVEVWVLVPTDSDNIVVDLEETAYHISYETPQGAELIRFRWYYPRWPECDCVVNMTFVGVQKR